MEDRFAEWFVKPLQKQYCRQELPEGNPVEITILRIAMYIHKQYQSCVVPYGARALSPK